MEIKKYYLFEIIAHAIEKDELWKIRKKLKKLPKPRPVDGFEGEHYDPKPPYIDPDIDLNL
tara:strand:+ start:126 stop:308 length:183 start_codon:yes stop_codon:yes gene_type:complete